MHALILASYLLHYFLFYVLFELHILCSKQHNKIDLLYLIVVTQLNVG